MSTITAILEPDSDGSLHLPLPKEFRHGKIHVTATLVAVLECSGPAPAPCRGFGALKGKIQMAPGIDDPLEDFRPYME